MSASILVVGAGVAGRSAARALALQGLGCTVVERRVEPTGRGMGINLPGNATRALAELGAADHVVAHGVPVRRRAYHNGAGRLLFSVDDEEFWRGVGPPVCLRHRRLLEALTMPAHGVTLEIGRATAARLTSSGVEVDFDGGDRRRFDFVIGADGLHSAMRGLVATVALRPSLMTGSSWRFVVTNPGIDCWSAWSGRTATVVLIPVEPDRVYGYAASTRGEQTGAGAAWLARTFGGFPRIVRDVIDRAVAGEGDVRHDPVAEVHVERWHRGRVVLIGDSAHATGPVWAQGAALAMEDALTLAEILGRTPAKDWAQVGPEFEQVRRPRVAHVQAATDRMSRLARLPGWVRDLSAPVLGPRTYREAYGPLRSRATAP